ncbi:MAG TPA: hypothetical protein ENJ97_00055, partial [Planctomycetes bacterium]|nr:hypothetical protein [Planctomycetota bacterium]
MGVAACLWAGCAAPGFPGGFRGQSAARTQAPREGPGKKARPRGRGALEVQAGRSREGALEEVVLTAGRREEDLFDTPRAVTVVNRQKIDRESRVSIL